jgi:hypothetical protein
MAEPAPTAPATVYIVYLPYLPSGSARARVGEWEIMPRSLLAEQDCVDARTMELAQGLADMYELPERLWQPVGAFARPVDGRVGDGPPEPPLTQDLARSMTVAILDLNQSPLIAEADRDPNFGHNAMTSDNATVVAHGIDHAHGYTSSVSGSRVGSAELGLSVVPDPNYPGLPRATFRAPADLRIPPRQTNLEYEYAAATWESLRRGDDAARRLGRAIDWLSLVGVNATALTDDLRIPAVRTGFEVLLDVGEDFLEFASALATLIEDESPAVRRTWPSRRSGNEVSVNLTNVGWWAVQFSFLRNTVMQGGLPDADDWQHDGAGHIDLGEWYLRQAIKYTVAADGHERVREDLRFRRLLEAARTFWRENRDPDDPSWE